MKARGFVVCAVFLLLFLVTIMIALAPLAVDSSVKRSAFAGQYMKLDAARKVGLDAGEAWILKAARAGYAPRAGSQGAADKPEERLAAVSASGSSANRIDFPGGIGIDVSVADLDYPAGLFGAKGSGIPLLPVYEDAGETGRYYLIRSTASDPLSHSLGAEELFLVSIDNAGRVTGARKIFYRSR